MTRLLVMTLRISLLVLFAPVAQAQVKECAPTAT